MFAVLLLCMVGITVAQRPVPCSTPPQWEGRVFDTNTRRQFGLQGRLSYDETNLRERIVDEVEEGQQTDAFDVIALFNTKVEYVIDIRARNCTRRPLTRPWRNFSISENATSRGEAFLGSGALPGAGLLVSLWTGNFVTPDNETVGYSSEWTLRGCVPVARTTFSQRNGISHLSFYDVTVGIRDPSVFIPPRECLTNEEWANRFTLFGPIKKN